MPDRYHTLDEILRGAPGRVDYDRIYRRLHPKTFPFSPYERQLELSDLWGANQEKFRREVNAILSEDPRNAK